jgi:DNA-binding LacI/PurR family transcriptional regulator
LSVITANTSTYGYAETIRGVEDAARAAGFAVMITVLGSNEPDDIAQQVRAATDRSIAGVVVLKFEKAGVAALKAVPPDLPVVALSGLREVGVPQALIDETRAAEELTGYLLSLGHETVHHVRIPRSRREDGRTTGWRRALRKAGARIPDLIDAPWDPRAGRGIGRQIAKTPGITAVFCGNDEIAMGVIRGIHDEGLRVPQHISVAGFDDHPLAELWEPALTTVHQDFADMGRRGIALLMSAIQQEGGALISSVRPPLVIRESTSLSVRPTALGVRAA